MIQTAFNRFLPASNPTRRWNELMLDEACRLLLDEVSLPGSAPGGSVEFKRTLVISFFFKFYLGVLQELKKLAKLFSAPVSALGCMCSLHSQAPSFPTVFANCRQPVPWLVIVLGQALSVASHPCLWDSRSSG